MWRFSNTSNSQSHLHDAVLTSEQTKEENQCVNGIPSWCDKGGVPYDVNIGMTVANMAIRSRKRRYLVYLVVSMSLVIFFVWQNMGGSSHQRVLLDLESNHVGYETRVNAKDKSAKTTNATKTVIPTTKKKNGTRSRATRPKTKAAFNVTMKPRKAAKKLPLHSDTCGGECEWLKLQRRRKDRVHEACAASFDKGVEFDSVDWADKKFRKHFDHILVSDQYQLLYCYVPKVGCTSWKRIFLALNGEVAASEVIPQTKVHTMHIPTLSEFTFKQADERLRKYTKFLFVRNPHERLLSAYKDKLETRNERNLSFRKYWGEKIFSYNRKIDQSKYSKYKEMYNKREDQPPRKRVGRGGEFDVTFQEFMRYVSDTQNKLNDAPEEHWREIHRLCSPCTINYDVIGKMETLKNDTHFILQRSGANELVETLGQSTNPTNSSKDLMIENAYAQLTKEDLNKFERRFQKDLDFFDYQRPKAITRLKSTEDDIKERVERLRYLTVNKPGEKNVNLNIAKKFQRPPPPDYEIERRGGGRGKPIDKDYFPLDVDNYYYYPNQIPHRRRDKPDGKMTPEDENKAKIREIEENIEREKNQLLHRIHHDAMRPKFGMMREIRSSSDDVIPQRHRDRFRRHRRRFGGNRFSDDDDLIEYRLDRPMRGRYRRGY